MDFGSVLRFFELALTKGDVGSTGRLVCHAKSMGLSLPLKAMSMGDQHIVDGESVG